MSPECLRAYQFSRIGPDNMSHFGRISNVTQQFFVNIVFNALCENKTVTSEGRRSRQLRKLPFEFVFRKRHLLMYAELKSELSEGMSDGLETFILDAGYLSSLTRQIGGPGLSAWALLRSVGVSAVPAVSTPPESGFQFLHASVVHSQVGIANPGG